MPDQRRVLTVHGISNLRGALSPPEAATAMAGELRPRLAEGYRAAGLGHVPVPELAAAYYAHLLDQGAQSAGVPLEALEPPERAMLWQWLRELGAPAEVAQGPATAPLREAMDWLARRRSVGPQALARVMTAVLREVYVYLTRPAVRARVRQAVAGAIEQHRPRVLVAHSLGTVVAYETLHATGAEVDLLITLGSPLGLPGAIFEALEPEPADGRGGRPPGVGRWVNIADPGDLVAVPKRLGDRFPVDQHEEAYLGVVDFHTLGGYLACGLTAAAIMPYAG
nr:hypothetical protein GCM10020063_011000 [Dactylosporangium thailandense]